MIITKTFDLKKSYLPHQGLALKPLKRLELLSDEKQLRNRYYFISSIKIKINKNAVSFTIKSHREIRSGRFCSSSTTIRLWNQI